MFLVRSAFWLTVAFIALHPRNVDLGAAASELSGQAIAAGQQIAVTQLLKSSCLTTRCLPAATPTVVTASAASPRLPIVDLTMQGSPTNRPAPVPRPRPAWMG